MVDFKRNKETWKPKENNRIWKWFYCHDKNASS